MVNYECLKGLEPAEFFRWFGAVSRIPRGSGKEAGFVLGRDGGSREIVLG